MKYMFAYWCLNDLLIDLMVNEGVESVRGRAVVGRRMMAEEGTVLEND
jgi:hypothetical protein